MSEDKKNRIIPKDKGPGFFPSLLAEARLVLRLLGDGRVSALLKLLPLGSVVYTVFPDLLPGPLDDALIVGVGVYLFIELCPPDVVAEHRKALLGGDAEESQGEEIIDAEYKEVPTNGDENA